MCQYFKGKMYPTLPASRLTSSLQLYLLPPSAGWSFTKIESNKMCQYFKGILYPTLPAGLLPVYHYTYYPQPPVEVLLK